MFLRTLRNQGYHLAGEGYLLFNRIEGVEDEVEVKDG